MSEPPPALMPMPDGYAAKVIERLSLRKAFPDIRGFSPRNLKYMRAFAETWSDVEFVQGVLAQLLWGHNLVLLTCLKGPGMRLTYAKRAIEQAGLVMCSTSTSRSAWRSISWSTPCRKT
jgi:hypothetical protein